MEKLKLKVNIKVEKNEKKAARDKFKQYSGESNDQIYSNSVGYSNSWIDSSKSGEIRGDIIIVLNSGQVIENGLCQAFKEAWF